MNEVFGPSVPRFEDDALVQAAGRFAADLRFPRMLVAAFVRSPYSHAIIKAVEVASAEHNQGIRIVRTFEWT